MRAWVIIITLFLNIHFFSIAEAQVTVERAKIPLLGPKIVSIDDIAMQHDSVIHKLSFRIRFESNEQGNDLKESQVDSDIAEAVTNVNWNKVDDVKWSGTKEDTDFDGSAVLSLGGKTPIYGHALSESLTVRLESESGKEIFFFGPGSTYFRDTAPKIFKRGITTYFVELDLSDIGLKDGEKIRVRVNTVFRDYIYRTVSRNIKAIWPPLQLIAKKWHELKKSYDFLGMLARSEDPANWNELLHDIRTHYMEVHAQSDDPSKVYDLMTVYSSNLNKEIEYLNTESARTNLENIGKNERESEQYLEQLKPFEHMFHRLLYAYLTYQIDRQNSEESLASPAEVQLTFENADILAFKNPVIKIQVMPDVEVKQTYGWGIAKYFYVAEIDLKNMEPSGRDIIVFGRTLILPMQTKAYRYNTKDEFKKLTSLTVPTIDTSEDYKRWEVRKKMLGIGVSGKFSGPIEEGPLVKFTPPTLEMLNTSYTRRGFNSPRNLSKRIFQGVVAAAAAFIPVIDSRTYSTAVGIAASAGIPTFDSFWASDEEEQNKRSQFMRDVIEDSVFLKQGVTARRIAVVPKHSFQAVGDQALFKAVIFPYQLGGDHLEAGVEVGILNDSQTRFKPGDGK